MHRSVAGGLPRAAVFGVNDGLVSNVSLILGFAGGGAGASVVRLAGIAGAVAGGDQHGRRRVGEHLGAERADPAASSRSNGASWSDTPRPRRPSWPGCTRPTGWTPDQARRAAADVMRQPDEALIVHAREELGVDPERAGVAVEGGRALAGLLPVRRARAGDPVARLGDGHGADDGVDRHRRRPRRRRRGADRRVRRAADRPLDRPPGADRARRLRRHLRDRPARRGERQFEFLQRSAL